MTKDLFYLCYALIGIGYWAVNIFIRKLPEKNDPDEGWILVPFWVFLWPLCFLMLIVLNTGKLFRRGKI